MVSWLFSIYFITQLGGYIVTDVRAVFMQQLKRASINDGQVLKNTCDYTIL